MLTYAAIDLDDMPTASGYSSLINEYSNKEFLIYTTGDQYTRWVAARDAAKAILDVHGAGYMMDLTEAVTADQIQTGRYEVMQGEDKVVYYGLDTRNSTVEDWNGSYTGSYMRKFIDPDPSVVDQNTRQFVPWPVFRFTEVVLNYVEACIELSEESEARAWPNRIRFRAGMPAITGYGDGLRDAYRNERRIELIYEEHRFHDARRWMIAGETLGRKVGVIRIFGRLKAGKSVSIHHHDPADYTYTVGTIDPGIENRQWLDKMYYLPIHRGETNRNGQLV